jgi:hypothetical protein
VIGNTVQKSVDFYRFDTNNDSRFTVSDVYSVFAVRNKVLNSFQASPPDSRIFTPAQWTTISGSTLNLKTTQPGVQTITINSPISGGTSNYYITRLGYSN